VKNSYMNATLLAGAVSGGVVLIAVSAGYVAATVEVYTNE